MSDLLATASAWLDGRRRSHLSGMVTYRRGALWAEVRATVGRTTFQTTDDYGAVQEWQSRDYLILAADLADIGLPQAGDTIVEADGAAYEVLAPGGEPAWRWSDPYGRTLRIHTKQVSAA